MNKELSISVLGAGGHAKVVVDAAYGFSPSREIIVYDSCSEMVGKSFLNKWIIQADRGLGKISRLHVAIGNNSLRKELSEKYINDINDLATIVHQKAIISASSKVFAGTFIASGAIIAPEVTLGYGAIINHAAIVDHDCIVGDWTHVAPNATLGGRVKVGKRVLVGAGAIILPGINVGDDAVIGAGAVVTKDVPAKRTVAGVPARSIG